MPPRFGGAFSRHVRRQAAERLATYPTSPPRGDPGRDPSSSSRGNGSSSSSSSSSQRWDADNSWDERGARSFAYDVKEACWRKAPTVAHRDPARWRKDGVGNIVFKKLVGCQGCLCYDFDHIVPYSKGGKSTLENCQVMQATANRAKGNRMEVSDSELLERSAYCLLSGRDMDTVELVSYGNISKFRSDDVAGCRMS